MKGILIVINIILMVTIFVVPAYAEDVHIITEISVEGNSVIPAEEILDTVKTKIGNYFNEEQLMADCKSIYELGYFADVSISFEPYNGGLNVIFEVIEYPVIKDIVIKGNTVYNNKRLLGLLGVEKGKVLNQFKLAEGRDKVEQLYHEDSYILASFSDINISDDGVLTLKIVEGYINEIIIEGNDKTRDSVIRRELEIGPGEPVNEDKILKSYRNLGELEYFKEIIPTLQPVENSNKVNLVFKIKEGKTRDFNGGVSWSSVKGWIGFTKLNFRNFAGTGRNVGFDWEFGGVNNYSINFYEPWLFGHPTKFGFSLYDKTSSNENSVKGEYEKHRYGGSFSFGRPLTGEWDGKVRFKVEKMELNWSEDAYEDEGETYDLINEISEVRSLTFETSRDTTNNYLNPTKGKKGRFSIEYAGQILGGDSDFTKCNIDLRRFYPGFKKDHAWAFRMKLGLSDGQLPELEKYRLGGFNTLRGYDHGIFSNDEILLLNAEYRMPIMDNINGVIFADTGNVWENIDEMKPEDFHYSFGLGFRMDTPIGQISIDYGFNEEGEGQPHFNIGHTF